LERLRTRMREIETHPYIAVRKDTSDEDVLSAARVIRAMRGKNPGGKPSRDKLTAIKCAALFHDHNFKDPQNKGRSRYTYESLVEEFELDPAIAPSSFAVALGVHRCSGELSSNCRPANSAFRLVA
jgi:hypothetical protein